MKKKDNNMLEKYKKTKKISITFSILLIAVIGITSLLNYFIIKKM